MNYLNKELVKSRFTKSFNTYEKQADVQKHIADVLSGKTVSYLSGKCNSILEIGCGTGFLTRKLLSQVSVNTVYLNDLMDVSNCMNCKLAEFNDKTEFHFLIGDAENVSFPSDVDVVVSASTLQWLTDLPAFFDKINNALATNGIFVFNSFGPNNYIELKKLLGAGLNYPTINELKEMLMSTFDIIEIWEETYTRYFDTPRAVLQHLKDTGVTANGGDFQWTKTNLQQFNANYTQQFNVDGKVTLTWHVLYSVCKKGNNN